MLLIVLCVWDAGISMQLLWPMGLLSFGAIVGVNNQDAPGVSPCSFVQPPPPPRLSIPPPRGGGNRHLAHEQ